jgi:hypothetical protein
VCRHDCGVALYPPPEVGGFTATTDKFIGIYVVLLHKHDKKVKFFAGMFWD